MEQIFAGHPCAIIVDDIIIGDKDPDEHERNLKKVLDRARQVKLRFNPVWTQRGELCWAPGTDWPSGIPGVCPVGRGAIWADSPDFFFFPHIMV